MISRFSGAAAGVQEVELTPEAEKRETAFRQAVLDFNEATGKDLKLLNTRVEESFRTGIYEKDI